MSSFIGKWKMDPEVNPMKGLDDFWEAAKYPPAKRETFRNLPYAIEFSKKGADKYEGVITFETDQIPVQRYSFKLGEAFEFLSIVDDKKPQLTITVEGEKLVESYNQDGKEWKTVRTVSGGVMTAATTCQGKTVTQTLKKV